MPRARRQAPHCYAQHDGDQAEQGQHQHERRHSPFRPWWYGGSQLRLHPSRLVRWSLSFGHFRRADNYLFHVSSASHTTKFNSGRTLILLDIRANCKARLVIRPCRINAQTGSHTYELLARHCGMNSLVLERVIATEPLTSMIGQKRAWRRLEDFLQADFWGVRAR